MMKIFFLFFFFKQKTADGRRISDWSSDVCSSDLGPASLCVRPARVAPPGRAVVLGHSCRFRAGAGKALHRQPRSCVSTIRPWRDLTERCRSRGSFPRGCDDDRLPARCAESRPGSTGQYPAARRPAGGAGRQAARALPSWDSSLFSIPPAPRSLPRGWKRTLSPDGQQSMSRSEEHTSELQSLMRISYAVFCLKKKTENIQMNTENTPSHITT